MKIPVRWTMEDTFCDAYQSINARSSDLHGHRHFLLTLITRGSGLQILNGKEINFQKGDAFLLSPADFHKNILSGGETYDYYGVKFNFETLDARLSASFGLNKLPMHVTLTESSYKKVLNLFAELIDVPSLAKKSSLANVYKKSLLEQLLILVLSDLEKSNSQQSSPFEVSVLGYVYSRFGEQISVADAASHVGYTTNHFNMRFKQAFGVPFSAYLRTMRLEYAKNLVIAGELSLTEIAFETGFLSLAHFSRVFKKVYGVSPQVYKTKNNEL